MEEHWQWQEPGKAWKGVGLYHITLTITNRQPKLGRLIVLDDAPSRANVVHTALGDALVDCLMPDHLHSVLYVRHRMDNDIRENSKKGAGDYRAGLPLCANKWATKLNYYLAPVFTEMPFIRSMARYSQLPNTILYLDMTPHRLATKRLKPGFFRMQKNIRIGDRTYDGIGNIALPMEELFAPVHVRRWMAAHGDNEQLRGYKNACVLKARQRGW